MQALGEQGVREPEHQRHVGRRDDGVPARFQPGRDVRAQRADQRDLDAGVRQRLQVPGDDVAGHAAGRHVHVLRRDAAERHQQLGVLDDRRPGRRGVQQRLRVPDEVRQQHLGGADAVGVPRVGEAAGQVQETVQLALRVVEAAGAGPAVRAAEDRLVAVGAPHARELPGEQVERVVPGDLDELLAARARTTGPGPSLEPAPPDRRRGDPRRVPQRAGDVAEQRRGRRVCGVRHDGDLAAGRHPDAVGAPVRGGRGRHGVHGAPGMSRGEGRPMITARSHGSVTISGPSARGMVADAA